MVRNPLKSLKSKPGNLATPHPVSKSRSTSPMRSKGDNASPDGRKDLGLVLRIALLRARNLAAKDRSGTSDPYLVLTLGDSKHVTHSVAKTLNPEWNEIADLPITGLDSLLLDVCCWDKDRFGKDYMGEFDLALEDIFADKRLEQPDKWYPLRSKRPGKKSSVVSGEVMLQFTLCDVDHATPHSVVLEKFQELVQSAPTELSRNPTPSPTPVIAPAAGPAMGKAPTALPPPVSRHPTDMDDDEDDDEGYDDETPEDEDPNRPEAIEKRKRRLRVKGLKRKKRNNPYELASGGSDLVGIIYLEISHVTDLPPESNLTKTSFDMDPFVVASLGKKTYRTKTIRHNLNPVYNEKMIFQVMNHERSYSFSFTVIDFDKYSGNDFIASVDLPVKELIDKAPKADLETGLYSIRAPSEPVLVQRPRFMRLGLSRTSSTQSVGKMGKPAPVSRTPSAHGTTPRSSAPEVGSSGSAPAPSVASAAMPNNDGSPDPAAQPPLSSARQLQSGDSAVTAAAPPTAETAMVEGDEVDFLWLDLPLKMKREDKWEAKHSPRLYIRAKYMPYAALRQQFWRALLRQYDTDESGRISKVEMTTMLDSLGSTLRESTIDSFFNRFPHQATDTDDAEDLTMDEAVICLEDQLTAKTKPATVTERVKILLPDPEKMKNMLLPGRRADSSDVPAEGRTSEDHGDPLGSDAQHAAALEESDYFGRDDLNVSAGEEHVVEIRECPICHQPRLNKRSDTDIITHIATCASQDWRQVNNFMMAGFVTSSQAQRKWYSKIITKISYGGYKLGANSANILVQDRITGQINEEKMSVYVRLGIRLLYKGLKSNNLETKRIRKLLKSLSIKQGKKYDDPASRSQIQGFIDFHRLNMSEVLRPVGDFKNFNEFFYRALKPGARPCSAPDRPRIVVSPADCRSVVFNRVDAATRVWVKGREFSVRRLLGDAYPEDVARYEGSGALGIFRLAPQDYHRFHVPVDGVMREPKTVGGEYYTVNPMAIRSALDVYGENVRVVVPIDSQHFGRVMFICIGAMMVGSTVITRKVGEQVCRAEELGYFKFGGSTVILLFETGKMVWDQDLVDNSNTALETLIRVGMSVGHAPNEPQWMPDMRKDDADITEAEKREAKRRIQGSGSTEESSSSSSPDDSGGDEACGTRGQ